MAKDLFHQAVKQALIKDGWTITSDALIIRIDRIKLEIDLAVEKVFAVTATFSSNTPTALLRNEK
jgi:XisH protein